MGLQNFKTLVNGLVLTAALLALAGCLGIMEDNGSTETVGTPVSGEADFTVEVPPEDPSGSEPDDEDTVVIPPQTPSVEFSVSIDQNAEYTHVNDVTMRLVYLPWFTEVKIANNTTCTGGTWEPLTSSKALSIHSQNAVNAYSVQFRDMDFVTSNCIVDSIIHDNQGPTIEFSKYPMVTLEEGATAEIVFNVKDVSPISSVSCKLNGIEKPCLKGANLINLTQMPEGQYEFVVTANDIHNFTSTKTINWNVVSTVKHMVHSATVKDQRIVDILIVIDNSGSMEYEQKNMASRVRNMLSILRGLDYRIAVTTTDPRATFTSNKVKYYGDGDLIPIANLGGKLWIDSTMDEQEAQYNLGQTLQRPETGSGTEQGIRATYRFVEKATTAGHAYNGFFRHGANFASLIISDEDESDVKANNDPVNLLNLVANRFNAQKVFSIHAIVTRPGDTACRSTYGYAYGERYKRATDLTGGILGSVCETDYAHQVSGIAEEIRDMVKNITLACEPLSQFPITVKKDGIVYSQPFTAEGVTLKFNDILDPGQYTVNYTCLK